MTETLTIEERAVMCHALGLQLRGKQSGVVYRNYYVCDRHEAWECDRHEAWEQLVDRGLASRSGPHPTMSGSYQYCVTDRGCEALLGRTLAEAEGRKMSVAMIRVALGG